MRIVPRTTWRFTISLALVAVAAALGPVLYAEDVFFSLPTPAGDWSLLPMVGRVPLRSGAVEVRGVGTLEFDPSQIDAIRTDVFQPGHFSVFDVLVDLADRGLITLDYDYDPSMRTHVIRSLNGRTGWWYDAHYAGGSYEKPVQRMDEFPVKDGMSLLFYLEDPDRLAAIETHFREEVERIERNGGVVIVPEVVLRTPEATLTFRNVTVTPHGTRSDVFRPGVVTALDVLLSLGDQGDLSSLRLLWRDRMEIADPIDAYLIEGLIAGEVSPQPAGTCAFAHDVGSATLEGFLQPHAHTMSHIHLSADLDVLLSPEYVEWTWVCL